MYNNIYTEEVKEKILYVQSQKELSELYSSIYDFSDLIDIHDFTQPIRLVDTVTKLNDYRQRLRDYQTVGVAYLYYAHRSILGDGVGLGKTVMISGLLNLLKVKSKFNKFIFSCDNNSHEQVLHELRKFTGLNIVGLRSQKAHFESDLKKYNLQTSIDNIDGIVVNHSALGSTALSEWLSQFITPTGKSLFDTFILDESSVIKNRNTIRYKWLENYLPRVERVHFLNATTVENSILDFYNQLWLLDPKAFPSKSAIEKMFCIKEYKQFYGKGRTKRFCSEIKGYKNTKIFRENVQLYYFGRASEEVGLVKDHNFQVRLIKPTELQQRCLKRKVASPSAILNNPVGIPQKIGLQFTEEHIPKLKAIIDMIDREFRDKKVFVYCFNKEAQKKIKEGLEKRNGIKCEILNGDIVQDERQQVISNFNLGECQVLISNIQKAVNLFNGEVCIFYSLTLNPARMEQIKGRIDRNKDANSLKGKTYILLLYDDTWEVQDFKRIGVMRGEGSVALTKGYDVETIMLNFNEVIGESK